MKHIKVAHRFLVYIPGNGPYNAIVSIPTFELRKKYLKTVCTNGKAITGDQAREILLSNQQKRIARYFSDGVRDTFGPERWSDIEKYDLADTGWELAGYLKD